MRWIHLKCAEIPRETIIIAVIEDSAETIDVFVIEGQSPFLEDSGI